MASRSAIGPRGPVAGARRRRRRRRSFRVETVPAASRKSGVGRCEATVSRRRSDAGDDETPFRSRLYLTEQGFWADSPIPRSSRSPPRPAHPRGVQRHIDVSENDKVQSVKTTSRVSERRQPCQRDDPGAAAVFTAAGPYGPSPPGCPPGGSHKSHWPPPPASTGAPERLQGPHTTGRHLDRDLLDNWTRSHGLPTGGSARWRPSGGCPMTATSPRCVAFLGGQGHRDGRHLPARR